MSKDKKETNLDVIISKGIVDTCKQMSNSWRSLSEPERDRIVKYADHKASDIDDEIKSRLNRMMNVKRANEHSHFAAIETGITLKEDIAEVKLRTNRDDLPIEIFNHKGSYLAILVNQKTTLEQFEAQGKMFDKDGNPIIDEKKINEDGFIKDEEGNWHKPVDFGDKTLDKADD